MLGGFWLWLDVDETVFHGDFKAKFFNYNMSNLCTERTGGAFFATVTHVIPDGA